jgi:ribosomal protein S18 acetylase RimI-like enzyme
MGGIMEGTEEVLIRRAKLDDMEEVEVLLQELIGDPLGERRKFFIEALSCENYAGFLAAKGEEVVGYVDLWGFPDPGHGAMLGVILSFIVTKDHRGKRIGDLLLVKAVEEAKRRAFKEFHVWTEFENETAKKIYRKHGFVNESLVLEREFE